MFPKVSLLNVYEKRSLAVYPRLRYLLVSIGLVCSLFPFLGWAVANQTGADELHRTLSQIDDQAGKGLYGSASVLVGRNLQAREIYRNYLAQADTISKQLLALRSDLARHEQTLNLQQLGARTQVLVTENQRFQEGWTHGEKHFQSARLIETAVRNLEDAINYWRMANRYRSVHRGSAREHNEDDQILRIKIQTALHAIDQLQAIVQTREALSKNLATE